MNEGFGVIPNWLVRDTTISGAAKMVYVVLSSHAGAHGTTWLSHTTIAAEAGTSVSTVQRALAVLSEMGLVGISQRRREDGGQTSNIYRLRVVSGVGQNDQPPRSEGPTPPVRVTDEEEPLKKNPGVTTSGRPRRPGRAEYSTEFEAFWEAYPRKEKKQDAARAFVAALQRTDLDTLIAHADRYRQDPNRRDAYTQHASTWLNNDGWLSAPLPARTTPGRPSANDIAAQAQALIARLESNPLQIGASRE